MVAVSNVTSLKSPSQIHICVEHAFAALKGRFQSLRELCLRIRSQDDLKYAVHWVQCCIILHNMIIRFEEKLGKETSTNWARKEAQEVDQVNDPPVVVEIPAATAGQHFHMNLMRDLFAELGMDRYVVNVRQGG